MTDWLGKPYYSLDAYLKKTFGEKVYKLSLDGGMTCPNRDGTCGDRGCIFCSAGGSGDFAGDRNKSIPEQIREQKSLLQQKRPVHKFIAYFQAYTNTYAPVEYLEKIFREAISDEEVVVLSIGTRPDCLGEEVLSLLEELNRIKPVWVELGLQTIHESTAAYIRRGYPLSCFEDSLKRLRQAGLEVVVHTILGLPRETRADMLATMDYLSAQDIRGIKLQLLHVLKGTDLAYDYLAGKFKVLEREEYIDLVADCLEHLDPSIVIHRVTGDGPKDLLIAPLWASRKREVLNLLHHRLKERHSFQGKALIRETPETY
jgi:radical SAM protein (TIGR01212 family)